MTLPSQGLPISLNQIHVEAGGTSGTIATINDPDIRALISKADGAQMSFSEWYGVSKPTPTLLNTTMTIGSSSSSVDYYKYSWTSGTTTINDNWVIRTGSGPTYSLRGYDGGADPFQDWTFTEGGDWFYVWSQGPNTMGSMGSTNVGGRTLLYLYVLSSNISNTSDDALYLGFTGTGTVSFTTITINGNTLNQSDASTYTSYGNRYYLWNNADGIIYPGVLGRAGYPMPASGTINVTIT